MSSLPPVDLARLLMLHHEVVVSLSVLRPQTLELRELLERTMARHRGLSTRLEGMLEAAEELRPESAPAGICNGMGAETRLEAELAPLFPAEDLSAAVKADVGVAPMPQVGQAVLVASRALTPSVRELTFLTRAPISYVPGQHVKLQAEIDGQRVTRDYSIARADSAAGLFLLWVKRVETGRMSVYMWSLPTGSRLTFEGPRGDFTLRPPDPSVRRVVFIATGTGLAPLYAMLETLLARADFPAAIELMWGVRTEADLFYRDELERMQRLRPGFSVRSALSDVASLAGVSTRQVTDLLRQEADAFFVGAEFYLAGNGAMINEVRMVLEARGVPGTRVHTEAFFKV